MTTEVTDTIAQRVARGIALLDEKLPGWHLRIDLDRLNLASSCNCILGQEFAHHPTAEGAAWSGFDVGVGELFDDDRTVVAFGFDADGFGLDQEGRDFAALTAEWRRAILTRRAAK